MLNFCRRRLCLLLKSLCYRIVVKAFVFDQEPWTVVLSTTVLDPNQIVSLLYCGTPTFARPIPVVSPDDQAWLLSPAQIFGKNQPFLWKYSFIKHSSDCLCNLFQACFVCQWTSSQSNQSVWNFGFWNFWCTRVLVNHVLQKIRAIYGGASQDISNCIFWLQLLHGSYLHSIEFSYSPNGRMIGPNQDNVLPKWWSRENKLLHALKKHCPWDFSFVRGCFRFRLSQQNPKVILGLALENLHVVWGSGPSGTHPHNCHCLWHCGREQPRLGRTAAVESNSSVCFKRLLLTPVSSCVALDRRRVSWARL